MWQNFKFLFSLILIDGAPDLQSGNPMFKIHSDRYRQPNLFFGCCGPEVNSLASLENSPYRAIWDF